MSKLNKLLQSIPKHGVVLDSWLKQHDISCSLKHKYLQYDWLRPLGSGASYRTGDTPNWQSAVVAMQQHGLSLHVGGKTALELQGAGHFIRPNILNLHLYGMPGQSLPQWFKQYDWQTMVHYYQTLFLPKELGLQAFQHENGTEFLVSAPERAFLELLYLVPTQQSIEEAYYILENLNDLQPELLQAMLEQCTSIKVKRLCLYLAERANHTWVASLDKTRINLGAGNRQIVGGGVLDPTYLITIPKSWKEDETPLF